MPVGPQVVDWRFAATIQRELEYEYAPPELRLSVASIARGLMMDRESVRAWWRQERSVSRRTAEKLFRKFAACEDYRGRIARRFMEIHLDHERWQRERNLKGFGKLYREVGPSTMFRSG